jgi:hypothetical protein
METPDRPADRRSVKPTPGSAWTEPRNIRYAQDTDRLKSPTAADHRI